MTPALTHHDLPDGFSRDAVLTGEAGVGDTGTAALLTASGVALSDRLHIGNGKFGTPVVLTGRGAPLDPHVSQILGLGTWKQVGWVDARWLVAAMPDAFAARDWPYKQLVGKSMRFGRDMTALDSDCKSAVAKFVEASEPRPAEIVVGAERVPPETQADGLPLSLVNAYWHACRIPQKVEVG